MDTQDIDQVSDTSLLDLSDVLSENEAREKMPTDSQVVAGLELSDDNDDATRINQNSNSKSISASQRNGIVKKFKPNTCMEESKEIEKESNYKFTKDDEFILLRAGYVEKGNQRQKRYALTFLNINPNIRVF